MSNRIGGLYRPVASPSNVRVFLFHIARLSFLIAAFAAVSVAWAEVKLTKVAEYDIPKLGCGGIAYLGGNNYLILQDHSDSTQAGNATVFPTTINVNGDTGALSGIAFGAGIPLLGNGDSEGIACDLCSGGIWISDEAGPTIKEFVLNADRTSYVNSRMAPIPGIYRKIRGNKGLEALTVSGDGLTMWTANEEALTVDGPASAENVATTVRLTKFTRSDVHDNWTVAGQWPYQCMAGFSSAAQSYCGLSGLCALPDGSLLTLEREVSTSTHGSCTVFLVTRAAIDAATPILDVPSLDGMQLTYVKDRWQDQLRYFAGTDFGHMIVYEGICLGPRLNDGALSVILVSDGGASQSAAGITAYTVPRLCAMKLSGLGEVNTISFAKPSVGRSSIEGSNYRFLNGEEIRVGLSGTPEGNPYAVDGTQLSVCNGWSTTAGSPSSGNDASATFRVAGDGVFRWEVDQVVAGKGYHIADSFEGFSVGTVAEALDGWSGEGCSVVAQSYAPPTPPGYVMTQETHTKVLDASEDGAVRDLPTQMPGDDKVDVMVCAHRPVAELEAEPDDVQIQVASDPQGRLCVWHSYGENGEWKRGWIPLSETIYADGEWVRLGFEFDYTSNPSGDAFAKVTVNGSCRPTAHGLRSPTDTRAYGPWYYLARNRRTGGVLRPSTVVFVGTKVDDLMLCRKSVKPEHTGAASADGIPFDWFDAAGLPREPKALAPFLPSYTLGDIFTAGLDPYAVRPFEMTAFWLDADRKPRIEFNGYKGEKPVGYRVSYSETPDFKNAAAIEMLDGEFDGDVTDWSTTWTGKSAAPSDKGFYRVEAFRQEENKR